MHWHYHSSISTTEVRSDAVHVVGLYSLCRPLSHGLHNITYFGRFPAAPNSSSAHRHGAHPPVYHPRHLPRLPVLPILQVQRPHHGPRQSHRSRQRRGLQGPDLLWPRRRRFLRHLVRSLQGHRPHRRQAQRDLFQRPLHPGRCRQGPLRRPADADPCDADLRSVQGWQGVGEARGGRQPEGVGGPDQGYLCINHGQEATRASYHTEHDRRCQSRLFSGRDAT